MTHTDATLPNRIAILMPLMNDWESFHLLLADLNTQLADIAQAVDVHIVDDYSIPQTIPTVKTTKIENIYCTRLVRNLGHQRAIAIGLVYLATHYDYHQVIVIDADGEDCPADVAKMIAMSADYPDNVIVAQRERRSEGWVFALFYRLYKATFRSLTGKLIDFGNFCLIPKNALAGLVYHAGLWNHLAATVVASRVPITKMPANRCERYAGQSSMNFTGLVIHGLSAVSIFLDQIAVRMIILAVIASILVGLGLVAVVMIRLFTDLAIPGWATSATGLLLLILGQTVLLILFLTFSILQQRSTVQIVPKNEVLQFVDSHQALLIVG
ncbi:MAG: glycosyltransferase [Phototrophicaceae bacterium]